MTSGLQKGDLVIVAGRPAMGKTSFCLNIAQHVALRVGETVGLFSLEMSKEQLALRLLCADARVDAHRLRTGKLNEKDWARLAKAYTDLSQSKLYIDDSATISPLEMRAKCRRLKAEFGLGLVIVDYLQLVTTAGRVENRQQEMSAISRSMKGLAKELALPVIALSQLSRAPEARTDRRPQLSDLRESRGDRTGCGHRDVHLPRGGAQAHGREPGDRGDHHRQATERADRQPQARLHQGIHALRKPRVARRACVTERAQAGVAFPGALRRAGVARRSGSQPSSCGEARPRATCALRGSGMTKVRTVFACQACGFESSKWLGRCPDCGDWNSFVEERQEVAPPPGKGRPDPLALPSSPSSPKPFDAIDSGEESRIPSGIDEFDRVLGGGIVPGSLVLIGGEPGIGKSTLILQVAHLLGRTHGTVLYVSGEESERQVKLRGERLGIVRRRPLPDGRDLARADPRAGRGPEAQSARRGLRPDRLLVALPVRTRQHQPGAGGGDAAAVSRQGPRRHDLPDRPRDEGRQHRRAPSPSSTSSTPSSTSRARSASTTASCAR